LILFISARNILVEEILAALPESTPLLHLASVAETATYLDASTGDRPEPVLILADADTDQKVIADCRRLLQKTFAHDLPLIALISQPTARQAVLEAGADDYLLLPLLTGEVQVRLSNYLRRTSRSLNRWINTFHQMSKGYPPLKVLNQSLADLVQIFNAVSAWMFLLDPAQEIELICSYELPPLFNQNPDILNEEIKKCLKIHQQFGADTAQVISSSRLVQADQEDGQGLSHYLSVPLKGHQHLIGVVNLIYREAPQISRIEKQALTMLSQDMGILLEMFHLQEETQVYATQNAFMVLIARTISEHLDPTATLSLTLEQTVPLFNASGGGIWLLVNNGRWLKLASSLSSPYSQRPLADRARGQGLVGWVVEHNQPLNIGEALASDPRFDPEIDQIEGLSDYSFLAVPLRHRDTTIGVLATYREHRTPFTDADTILLEGIASLTASAIANARLMQDLRDYAAQQRVLYEMSQQIAAGLDLQNTLDRALQWMSRLIETEIGLLWLVDTPKNQDKAAPDSLYLVAAVGIEFSGGQKFAVSTKSYLVDWIERTAEAIIINDPDNDPRFDPRIVRQLNIDPQNLISMPMNYHGEVIGIMTMFNKIGGSFGDDDLTLLATAIEMVAVAVGNARLHTQTLNLMTERERLNKQILQSERLAIVGRLTASLSHEINNPMQAIRGALTLALEELHNPKELTTYIQMSLEESERVVQLIDRMRQIYRPRYSVPDTLDVNQVLQEAISIAHKELRRQRVRLEADLASELPPLTAIPDQLQLVFLIFILNLSNAIGAAGGGQLRVRSYLLEQAIQIEFATPTSISALANWAHIFKLGVSQLNQEIEADQGDTGFGLSLSHDIINAHEGIIECERQNNQIICRIVLPFSSVEMLRE
jgi:GAF domain-containing protein